MSQGQKSQSPHGGLMRVATPHRPASSEDGHSRRRPGLALNNATNPAALCVSGLSFPGVTLTHRGTLCTDIFTNL